MEKNVKCCRKCSITSWEHAVKGGAVSESLATGCLFLGGSWIFWTTRVYLPSLQQHHFYCYSSRNMYANGKTQSMLFHSSLNPLCFMVRDLSQASCKSWLSGIFCLVYYLSLDCGIEFPCTAAAAESQGRAWIAFEMKQTEHRRLFIRSKPVIVEKVWAATTCWCARGEVEAMWWWCHQVRTVSKRAAATRFARRVTDEESNQYQKWLVLFWWGSEADTQTVKTTAAQNIVRRAANMQIQHRTHNNNNNHSKQTIQ